MTNGHLYTDQWSFKISSLKIKHMQGRDLLGAA